MNEKQRITLTDSVASAIAKMAGGNPGALTVCVELFGKSPKIDPVGSMGGFGPILLLDSMGVYESKIWILYKDVCKQSVTNLVALLRSWQMGMLNGDIFSVDRDFPKLILDLKTKLPEFSEATN